ncbi:MAG: hypothetical protein RR396_03475, partial [Clostridiales bacterium]
MKCKKYMINTLFSLVVFALAVGIIYDFSRQLQVSLTKETYSTLSGVSKDYNKAFLDRISYNVQTMNIIAGNLSEMDGLTKQEIMHILQNAVDEGGFTKMVVCNANGTSCSNEGIS